MKLASCPTTVFGTSSQSGSAFCSQEVELLCQNRFPIGYQQEVPGWHLSPCGRQSWTFVHPCWACCRIFTVLQRDSQYGTWQDSQTWGPKRQHLLGREYIWSWVYWPLIIWPSLSGLAWPSRSFLCCLFLFPIHGNSKLVSSSLKFFWEVWHIHIFFEYFRGRFYHWYLLLAFGESSPCFWERLPIFCRQLVLCRADGFLALAVRGLSEQFERLWEFHRGQEFS